MTDMITENIADKELDSMIIRGKKHSRQKILNAHIQRVINSRFGKQDPAYYDHKDHNDHPYSVHYDHDGGRHEDAKYADHYDVYSAWHDSYRE